jgi:hypothetical protein
MPDALLCSYVATFKCIVNRDAEIFLYDAYRSMPSPLQHAADDHWQSQRTLTFSRSRLKVNASTFAFAAPKFDPTLRLNAASMGDHYY